MRRSTLLVTALLLVAMSTGGAQATAVVTPVQPDNPFVGVIRNYTARDVEVPSLNSMGTITVPAKGWVEYRVWSEHFNFIGYVDGQPFHCEKVQVDPDKYQLFCKSYDFVVEIRKEEPRAPSKKLKKRIKKRKASLPVEQDVG
ncbi:MAG: hypothetical protein K6T55_07885 [Syntrophobacterales bacterium]|nr:hypothetical protein [Syntrophobacterales bacterium]